jgi:hypothetical protein
VLRGANLTTPVIMSTGRPPAGKFVAEPRLRPFLVLQKPHQIKDLLEAVAKKPARDRSPRGLRIQIVIPEDYWLRLFLYF